MAKTSGMKVTWLRNLVRKNAALGLPIAGLYLILRWTWQRKPLGILFLASSILLSLFWLRPPAHTESAYMVTDLGVLPSGYGPLPASINSSGQIVGSVAVGKDEEGEYVFHSFLWEKGRIRDLGNCGGISNWASCINDRGQVAFTVKRATLNSTRAYLWEKGRLVELPGL